MVEETTSKLVGLLVLVDLFRFVVFVDGGLCGVAALHLHSLGKLQLCSQFGCVGGAIRVGAGKCGFGIRFVSLVLLEEDVCRVGFFKGPVRNGFGGKLVFAALARRSRSWRRQSPYSCQPI